MIFTVIFDQFIVSLLNKTLISLKSEKKIIYFIILNIACMLHIHTKYIKYTIIKF